MYKDPGIVARLVRNEVQRLDSISVEHKIFSMIYPAANQALFHKVYLFTQISV